MVLESVQKVIAERLEIETSEVTPEKTFTELGIDSLDTVELLMELEDEIGMEIELEESVATVGELVAAIEAKKAEA